MKSTIAACALLMLFSCAQPGSETKTNNRTDKNNIVLAAETEAFKPAFTGNYNRQTPAENPMGYYTGMFEAEEYDENQNIMWANRITISIDSVKEKTIYGHSIVAGNNRPFTGELKKNENGMTVIAKEPGDDKYDGVFTFTVSGDNLMISGTWSANDKTLGVTKRIYELNRREFKYDENVELPEFLQWEALYGTYDDETAKAEGLTKDVLKFNASNTLLKARDVENLFKGDLEVIRNAIYARHGYSFKNRKMRFLFDNYIEWYMPVSVDITNDLTAIEKRNIEIIKRYEAHAEKYYDVFGR
ncbi:MAG: YARHG domain-containing protein [Chitinophagales bacterium]|nr:YARHG domain-containing protein [Chitinophagales bacterium]